MEKAGLHRRFDALANILLGKLGSRHPCGCYFDMYHLPKHCCRPHKAFRESNIPCGCGLSALKCAGETNPHLGLFWQQNGGQHMIRQVVKMLNGGSCFPQEAINVESKRLCNMKCRSQWSKTDPEKAHFIMSARRSCNYHLLES